MSSQGFLSIYKATSPHSMLIAQLPFDLSSKTIVITGSSGLLGSHLMDALSGSNANIRVLLRRDISPPRYPGIRIRYGDVREGVDNQMSEVDLVFHLAAIVNVDSSIREPLETVETNTLGTLRVLESIRKSRSNPHLIISSSTAIYGVPQTEPLTETHPLVATNPHTASKIAAESLCQGYANTYGIPTTILRLSSLYGPKQRSTQVIASVVLQCLHHSRVKVGPVDTYRDFCYVKDGTLALLLAASRPPSGWEVYNISSGKSTRIDRVIGKIIHILDRKIRVVHKSDIHRRNEMVRPFHISWEKARKELGWAPKYTLEQGLKETIEWYRSSAE